MPKKLKNLDSKNLYRVIKILEKLGFKKNCEKLNFSENVYIKDLSFNIFKTFKNFCKNQYLYFVIRLIICDKYFQSL